VPSWGSQVRLGLPVPLSSIILGLGAGFGAFGAHEGGHVEGLNHIWILTIAGTTVRSWAAGKVTKIEDMGDRGIGNGVHEWFITIDYGQGLVGKYLDVDTPLVKVGDTVREGDAIARAPSAEFMLIDSNRTDGERTVELAWSTPDGAGKVVMRVANGAKFYGLYAVDESSGRAKLTIQWQTGGYPSAMTSNAAVYVERGPIYLQGDAQKLALVR
jgi:hypothetical protein